MEKREQIIDLLNKCIIGESVANTADRILDLFSVVGQSEQLKPIQKCYKSGEPCKFNCSGLCKESC